MSRFLKYFLLATIVFLQLKANAQTTTEQSEDDSRNMNVLLVNPNGSLYIPGKYPTLTNGSPFYKDEFLPATIFFAGNKAAKSEKVRLDLLGNNVHFLNEKLEEYIITLPVLKLIIDNPDNTKDYFVPGTLLPIENANYRKNWFQVIQQNEITIYKMYSKKIQEYKPINSAVLEQSIETYEKYFMLKDGVLIESKKYKPKK